MSEHSDNEEIDRRLAAFFKAALPQTWPAPPATAAPSEPSTLIETRNETRALSSARRDSGRQSRLTLAACVAFLLVAGAILTNGYHPAKHPNNAPANGGTDVLAPASAKTPEELRDAMKQPAAPPGDMNDMLDKSN
jgi:hypothetical protein